MGFPPPLVVTGAPAGLEGIEFKDDRGRVAVIFGRPHDAVFAVAGVKGGDADHQGVVRFQPQV
jgi:hypothetical protein